MSEAQIRAELAAEEEQEVHAGNVSLHEVTPVTMMTTLLDLEDQQYVHDNSYV